ncbi:hypothetical protein GLP59_05975 [Sulfitobacter sp. M220]|nr:hypothetical protein [Sulfitobacter sp. M220]
MTDTSRLQGTVFGHRWERRYLRWTLAALTVAPVSFVPFGGGTSDGRFNNVATASDCN